MTVTSVVRPLPGPGLVARSGDLMLVCAEGIDATREEVEQLLNLVPEVAAAGGDGTVLVRRVAALLAADMDGLFPDCAVCGPVADGRLAVLVYGAATARVVGGDGEVRLSAVDAVASVNRLIPGPITSVRLELPGAGQPSRFARLEGGVVSAAGFVAGEEAPGGAASVFAAPAPSVPAPSVPAPSVPAPSVPAPSVSASSVPAPSVSVPPVPAQPGPALAPDAKPDAPTPPAETPAWTGLAASLGAEPSVAEPASEPAPAVPDPVVAEPPAPVVAEPAISEPAVQQPAVAEPAVPEPAVPEPVATPEPVAAAPEPAIETPAPPPDAEPAVVPSEPSGWIPTTTTPEPSDAPAVPSWAGPSVVDASVVPADVTPPPASVSAPPLPTREPLATAPTGLGSRPTVLGLACPQGHLNDPSLTACVVCGSGLVTQPPALREGPRPPLGMITLDDGTQYLLDTGYVLGREPQHDPEVVAGGAKPLKIVDVEGVVSRRHLRVALVGWDIQIIDLGSSNGTYVQYPDDPQLHRLDPHHAIVVKVGTTVTMGRRTFRIDPVPPEQRG